MGRKTISLLIRRHFGDAVATLTGLNGVVPDFPALTVRRLR